MTRTTLKNEEVANPNTAITFALSNKQCLDIANLVGHCIGNEPHRLATFGLCFENSSDGLRAVATDGLRLGQLTLTSEVMEAPHFTRIVPREAIDLLGKLSKKGEIFIVFKFEGQKLTLELGTSTMTFNCVDCSFPDYRGVIPERGAPTVKISCDMLIDAARAAKRSGKAFLSLHVSDPNSAVHVSFGRDDYISIIMPGYQS